MELKLVSAFFLLASVLSRFNRTFMELKYNGILENTEARQRFNRTFMELKYKDAIDAIDDISVLIVPLWN